MKVKRKKQTFITFLITNIKHRESFIYGSETRYLKRIFHPSNDGGRSQASTHLFLQHRNATISNSPINFYQIETLSGFFRKKIYFLSHIMKAFHLSTHFIVLFVCFSPSLVSFVFVQLFEMFNRSYLFSAV